MPKRSPRVGDRVRTSIKSKVWSIISKVFGDEDDEVEICDRQGKLIVKGSWKELSKIWLIMKRVNTQRRVLTIPLPLDDKLARIATESGCSPEAAAIAILEKALATV